MTLVDVEGATFEEGFLPQTARRLLAEGRHREVRELRAFLRAPSATQPSGVIFHVGRCGSTLVSSLVNACLGVTVIKESPFLNAVIRGHLSSGSDFGEPEVIAAARSAAALSGKVVLKTTSWNAQVAPVLCRAFPDAPVVVLTRTAEASVASNVRDPPGWAAYRTDRDRSAARELWPSLGDGELTPVEFFAHAWRSTIERVLKIRSALVVDYDQFHAAPRRVIAGVWDHLRVPAPPDEAAVESLLATDSKQGSTFRGSIGSRDLSPEERKAIRAICAAAQAELDERLR